MRDTPTPLPRPDPLPGLGRRLGVFDSGLGGLSVLRALRRALPGASLLYAADSGHAPYGERDAAHVQARSARLAEHLRGQGAELLVIACNTATAVAAAALRDAHPGWPIVGVEPGLKPALAATRNGRVGVMATQATLASPKFARLVDATRAAVPAGGLLQLQACPGLAAAIEAGEPDAPAVQAEADRHAAPLRAAGVDTVVLGCTHYPFAAAALQAALGPGVVLVDTAEAVAREAARRCAALVPAPTAADAGGLRFWTSGDPAGLARFLARWLDLPSAVVEPLPV